MRLDRVTLTGADDSVSPMDLVKLSREFPFVEWGILVSARHSREPRFPSHRWIAALQDLAEMEGMKLALHVCGRWVREFVGGEKVDLPPPMLRSFQRVQLNFHGEPIPLWRSATRADFAREILRLGDRQVIFQIDGALGAEILGAMWDWDKEGDLDLVPLHDISHGTGVLPRTWPPPLAPDVYQGYAGGLGPTNVAEQISMIEVVARFSRVWIDMETKLRSDDGASFEISKCREVLERARPHLYRAPEHV